MFEFWPSCVLGFVNPVIGNVHAVPARYAALFKVNVTANKAPVKPSDAKLNLASPHPLCVPNDGVPLQSVRSQMGR